MFGITNTIPNNIGFKTMAIKPTQLTRVGYSYQDLWCIKLLIDWFHQPELYQWMTIENSESGPHKFQGLDVC